MELGKLRKEIFEMLTVKQAADAAEKYAGNGLKVLNYADWNGLYILEMQPETGDLADDSFLSVDKETGEVKEFAPLLLDDPDDFFDNAKPVPYKL